MLCILRESVIRLVDGNISLLTFAAILVHSIVLLARLPAHIRYLNLLSFIVILLLSLLLLLMLF